MKEIDRLCNEVLQKTQGYGGSISGVMFQQIVGAENYRQVKMKLLALELIEKREDNKIKLTTKGLNVKTVKEASKKEKD